MKSWYNTHKEKEMKVMKTMEQLHQEDLQRLRGLRLIDDDFLTKCFDDSPECVELVLQIVLGKPDIKVLDVATQVYVANLLHRSVRLDVLATDNSGRKLNIEIQRTDKGAGAKRARFNSSMLDAKFLEKGEDFDELNETYVIFITEHDVLGKGLPVYTVERYIEETGGKFNDGSHILYVNGEYREADPLGKLMNDFFCTNPGDMHYPVLAERTKYFKESKEGVAIMCKVMEDMRNQAQKESLVNAALRLLEMGKNTLDEIAKVCSLSVEEVEELAASRNK